MGISFVKDLGIEIKRIIRHFWIENLVARDFFGYLAENWYSRS
jgi:hypothetical protein